MSTGSYWRDRAAPIIREVIARVGRDDERALRKALHDACPFGERQLHPYKIWRDEIRRQLEGRQGHHDPTSVLSGMGGAAMTTHNRPPTRR